MEQDVSLLQYELNSKKPGLALEQINEETETPEGD